MAKETKEEKKFERVVEWKDDCLFEDSMSFFGWHFFLLLVFLILSPIVVLIYFIEETKKSWRESREVYWREIK